MTGTLLSGPDQQERLSLVYIRALAARAGFVTSKPDLDRDSVALQVQAGGPKRPAINLQVKATTNLGPARGGHISFRLSIKNANDLREDTQTPRLLVVFEMPPDESNWMTVTPEELILRRRAYWLSLQGGNNRQIPQQTVTVSIPTANVLDVAALQRLMEQSRLGKI